MFVCVCVFGVCMQVVCMHVVLSEMVVCVCLCVCAHNKKGLSGLISLDLYYLVDGNKNCNYKYYPPFPVQNSC